VAFINAFHGMSLGALAAGARHQHRRSAGVDLDGVVRLPYDGYLDAGRHELDRYEAMVRDPAGGAEPPAAFIVETVQGEGGLNVARTEGLQHLAATASRLGALLIIVCAGRLRPHRRFFSFERMRISQISCAGKIDQHRPADGAAVIGPSMTCGRLASTTAFCGNNLAFVAATSRSISGAIAISCVDVPIHHIVQRWLDDTIAAFTDEGLPRGAGFSPASRSRITLARRAPRGRSAAG
jgi:diaminobutyrate-2-oxoglutarate transaminase